MKTKIHKIIWSARYNRYKTDITLEVTDVDCIVKKATHHCANWAIGKYWHILSKWFQNQGATIILGEERIIADEFPRLEINPRRLSDREWLQRIRETKS